MDYQDIVYEQRNQAAWIYLNRPETMNSITSTMMMELEDALDKIQSDDDIRIVVVSGKGGVFCAGMDLKESLKSMGGNRSRGLMRWICWPMPLTASAVFQCP